MQNPRINPIDNRERRAEQGQALIEFALTMPILLLMAFGAFATSQLLERYLTVLQVVRNAGNMYSRSVDFSVVQNRQLFLEAANGLSMTLDGGDAVVYLSTVEIADSGANIGEPVVTHRIVIGNAGLQTSGVATPSVVLPSGQVSDFENDPNALASVAGTLSLESGDLAYVVEAFHDPTDIPIADQFFGDRRLTAGAYY